MKVTKQQIQYLISKFVETDKVDWKKETVAAKRIFSYWPRMDFWCVQEPKKFGSLLCLLTPKSRNFLTQKYNEYVLENPIEQKYHLQDAPVQAEEIKINQKPKNLMEFLNG